MSQCSTNMEESIFRSGFIGQVSGAQSNIFKELDAESQAELGVEFGDNEFGTMGKEQLQNFFQNEEAECLKENPFIEEEPCAAESPGNSSVMSGTDIETIYFEFSCFLSCFLSCLKPYLIKMDLHSNLMIKVA